MRLSFVCLGNICRSPTAEAVMRHLVREAGLTEQVMIDSAGTGDWHIGEPRDRRSTEVGRKRGMPLSGTARQFQREDFARFDYVLAMDRQNLENLRRLAPDDAARGKIHLLRSFDCSQNPQRVPHLPPSFAPNPGSPRPSAGVGWSKLGGSAREDGTIGGPGQDEVPDPYYGGPAGFDEVIDICERACRGLLAHVRKAHGLP